MRSWSALKNDLREGLIGGVRDAEYDVFHFEAIGDMGGFAGELDRWAAALFAHYFDVNPADTAAPAGAERFHGGFFRGKAACVTLVFVFKALAVFLFLGGVQAAQEGFAVALDGGFDAGNLCDINT